MCLLCLVTKSSRAFCVAGCVNMRSGGALHGNMDTDDEVAGVHSY